MKIDNLPSNYCYDQYGFLKQTKFDSFKYTFDYCKKQSTNIEMSYLRLGWLSSFFSYEKMQKMNVVDIGCGNGSFVKCCQGKFGKIVGYDVVGNTISKEELYGQKWDLIVLSDVLEHFDNIDDLLKINWKHAMISFPETPNVDNFEELKKWRHFKPNEHLYSLTLEKIQKWFNIYRCGTEDKFSILGTSNFEDLIRTRWNKEKTNISTILVERFVNYRY